MDTSILPAQSSPAETPSPPPIRYFDLLPTELLQEIIEHLAPIHFDDASYAEYRKNFGPLCLTSKRLSLLTQPVLARALWLRHESIWHEEKGRDDISCGCKREDYWGNCRWLRLVVYRLTPNIEAALQRLAAVASELEDVGCAGDIFTFDRFMHHNITKLHLHNLTLPTGFKLYCPSLEQLSLSYTKFSSETNLNHNVPALRHLALFPSDRNNLRDRLITSLAPQLSTVSTPLYPAFDAQSLFPESADVQILYSCDISLTCDADSLRTSHTDHLQLTASREFGQVVGNQETRQLKAVNSWLDLLSRQSAVDLKSLYLPSFCSPDNPALLPSFRDAFESILSICQQRSIEVIFESTHIYHVLDSPISVDFVKRSEENRRAHEKEKGDGP